MWVFVCQECGQEKEHNEKNRAKSMMTKHYHTAHPSVKPVYHFGPKEDK